MKTKEELNQLKTEYVKLNEKLKVYIVSPSTLMAYITALKSIYLGQLKNEKAKEIEILLNDLANDFQKFKERSEALQKDYEKIGNDFRLLNITSNKLIKRFDKLEHGDIETGEIED